MAAPVKKPKDPIALTMAVNAVIARGAKEGPLKDLIPVFIDFETFMTKEISLKTMTLRQYLAASYVEMIAVAIGEDDPEVYTLPGGEFKEGDEILVSILTALAEDPKYVFVAHNAAFDIRVMRFVLGVPQPKNVWCTLEGSMGAWPELPGGFSLGNIPKKLCFPANLQKIHIDLLNCTEEEKEIYNKQDVKVMQEIYYRQAALIPGIEQEVALRTHRQRQFHFKVDSSRLASLIEELNKQASYAEKEAEQYITEEDAKDIFNRDNEDHILNSVRSLRLRRIINEKMDANMASTSLKKISPLKLAAKPRVAALLAQTSRVSKMLSHKRRSTVFLNVNEVDVELGVFRAHTFRFSSPSTGRGLNLHNIPKHDAAIAKPVREIFRLPSDLCFVRADLANVEYRVEGKLTGCKTVIKMFDETQGGNKFNDPYCEAWAAMTRQKITKKSPIRQVAKAAVLGLGFCMGPTGYARGSLLPAIADKKSGVTEDILKQIAIELQWREPAGEFSPTKKVITDLGCSYMVALAAYSIHRSFNNAHPEFSMTADWLDRVVKTVASCVCKENAERVVERAYQQASAPDPAMIRLSIDTDGAFSKPSIRVNCGPWVPTVCWREPKMRATEFSNGPTDIRLTIVKSTGIFKPFTRQLAIENITQAAARNSLCWGVGELEKLGFPNVLHIHDEIMIITKRERESVLAARDGLVKVFGPNGYGPMGWAVLVKPSEISVTESMWESEEDITPTYLDEKTGKMKGGDRWAKIEKNLLGCLDNLP